MGSSSPPQSLRQSGMGVDALSPDERRTWFADCVEAVAGRGDEEAFGVLFDYFAPRLKSFAIARGCDDKLAEEITQDVMTALWRKASLYDRRQSSVSTWLFRIARNRHIDLIRRDARRQLDVDDPTHIPEAEPLPDEMLRTSEREQMVREAVTTLPGEQREVLRLAFFEGLTHSEIAERIAIPMGTVKSRLRLAFGKLRSLLDRDP